MQEKKFSKAEIVLSSLKNHYKIKTYGKLAEFLGVTEGALYSWRSRGIIGDQAAILSKCKGINPDWVKTAQGEMFLTETREPIVEEEHHEYRPEFKERDAIFQKAKEETKEMSDAEFYRVMAAIFGVIEDMKSKKGGQ